MQHLLWLGLGFAVALVAILALRWAVMTVLARWATGPGALAAFLQAVRLPSLLWCGVIALYATIEVASEAEVLPRRLTRELTTILQAAVILSVTITLAGIVETLITRVGESRALGVPVTGLARAASRLTILAVGFLVLLSALGIQIAPILTALGVGGLAVALAHYVKIADSVEGYVVDVGWRSTRVRMLQDNVVVVPNKRVAESIITNYDLPQSRLALPIRVSVEYDSDPDRVEAVLVDEATQAAQDVPGLLDDPRPTARLIPGFGESSLDFTLVCHVASFVDQYPVQHELRKRILRRLRAEGIGMPFPTRTVELRDSGDRRGASELRDAGGPRESREARAPGGGSRHARAFTDRGEHGERDQHETG